MAEEAKLERTENGLVRRSEGWFVANMADLAWWHSSEFGLACTFAGDVKFPQFGMNVRVLQPGQPNCRYHHETMAEAFMVLQGQCVLLIDEQEKPLRAWDFVYCPPGTPHVFVGAGDGPCIILMVGARGPEGASTYPVSELALRHGAGVTKETTSAEEAYADCPWPQQVPSPWNLR